MVTGSDGWAVSGSLQPGFYWVKETGKTDGSNYVIDSTKKYPANDVGYEVKANEMTIAADTVENPLGLKLSWQRQASMVQRNFPEPNSDCTLTSHVEVKALFRN